MPGSWMRSLGMCTPHSVELCPHGSSIEAWARAAMCWRISVLQGPNRGSRSVRLSDREGIGAGAVVVIGMVTVPPVAIGQKTAVLPRA